MVYRGHLRLTRLAANRTVALTAQRLVPLLQWHWSVESEGIMWQRVVILAVIAVAVCAGCGDSETDAGSSGEDYESPLAEYMPGFGFSGDPEDMEAQMLDQQRLVNEQVVECMAAEGFEWIPDDESMMFSGLSGDSEGLEYGSDEWVAKYGFGISTQMFPQEVVGPDLVGMDETMFGGPGDDYEDPNAEYLATLSEAETEAYNEALYGTDTGPEIDESMSEEEIDEAFREWEANNEPTGCMNIAQEEMFGGQDFFLEFGNELEGMWERVESDPRIVEANAQIAECVADKGLSFTSLQDANEDIWERVEPMQEELFGAMEEITISDEEAEAMSPEELEAMYAPDELSDDAKAQLAEIQAEEIELAVAVQDCGGGYSQQQELYQEILFDIETRFVEENEDRLEEFKARQESETSE